jgi:hypothetical protein
MLPLNLNFGFRRPPYLIGVFQARPTVEHSFAIACVDLHADNSIVILPVRLLRVVLFRRRTSR